MGLSHGAFVPLVLLFGALATATLSGAAGLLLWRRRRFGLILSLLVQGLQIIGVATPAFDWRLKLGVNVTIEVSSIGLMTRWALNGLYDIGPWSSMPQRTVTFNALALVAFVYLLRLGRRDPVWSGAPATSVSGAA